LGGGTDASGAGEKLYRAIQYAGDEARIEAGGSAARSAGTAADVARGRVRIDVFRDALGHSADAGGRGADTLYQASQPLDARRARPARPRRASRHASGDDAVGSGCVAAEMSRRDLPGAIAPGRDLLPKVRNESRRGGPSR